MNELLSVIPTPGSIEDRVIEGLFGSSVLLAFLLYQAVVSWIGAAKGARGAARWTLATASRLRTRAIAAAPGHRWATGVQSTLLVLMVGLWVLLTIAVANLITLEFHTSSPDQWSADVWAGRLAVGQWLRLGPVAQPAAVVALVVLLIVLLARRFASPDGWAAILSLPVALLWVFTGLMQLIFDHLLAGDARNLWQPFGFVIGGAFYIASTFIALRAAGVLRQLWR